MGEKYIKIECTANNMLQYPHLLLYRAQFGLSLKKRCPSTHIQTKVRVLIEYFFSTFVFTELKEDPRVLLYYKSHFMGL